MPDDAALLAAIDADPDDDAPRLAHADWVEANGDPARAAFIRLEVGSASLPFHERYAAQVREGAERGEVARVYLTLPAAAQVQFAHTRQLREGDQPGQKIAPEARDVDAQPAEVAQVRRTQHRP